MKKIILIVIGVIILIAAFIYFLSLLKPDIVPRSEEEPLDWQTYQNARYSFSIEYPSQW